MRSALSIMQGEHEAFATALQTLCSRLRTVRAHAIKPHLKPFATGISFIETFIDHFHHPKEDEFLFPALCRRTRDADDALRELQFDHATGPHMLEELKASLARAQTGGIAELDHFADEMERYARVQLEHINMEDGVVMPIARRVLAARDWEEIDRAFRANLDPLFSAALRGKLGGLFRPVTV